MRNWLFVVAVLCIGGALWIACAGGNKGLFTPAQLTVTVSDPAVCNSAQGGLFSHVFLTVVDVQASTNAGATAGSSGLIDLTPGLTSSGPIQIDLLGQPDNSCFLAELASVAQIPAGSFATIFITLAGNGSTLKLNNNACGSAPNCVVLANGAVIPLLLANQPLTTLRIPSTQISGGQFVLAPGETVNLDIDFNTCASLIAQAGQFLLQPVLHAGKMSLSAHSINGTLVDSATQKPIAGKVAVAAEQRDAHGIDRIVMETLTDASGNFLLCPLPPGNYDIVIAGAAISGTTLTDYGATVIQSVPAGTSVGTVPLVAQPAPDTAPGIILGQVTSDVPNVNISASALQPIASGGINSMVTLPVPAAASSTTTFSTNLGIPGCPANLACGGYGIAVPAANLRVGTLVGGNISFTPAAGPPVNVVVDLQATANGGPVCLPPEQQITTTASGTPLTVTAGQSITAAPAAFTSCSF